MLAPIGSYTSKDTIVACAVHGRDVVWTAELNGWIRGRNVADGAVERQYRLVHGVDPTSLLVDADGRLWVGRTDGVISIFDTTRLEHVRDCHMHDDNITALTQGIAIGTVVSACGQGQLALWDATKYLCVASRQIRHHGALNCVCSLSENQFISHDDDHHIVVVTVVVSDGVSSLKTTLRMPGHEREVFCCIAISEHLVFSGSHDETIRMWDIAQRSCVRVVTHHNAAVHSLSLLAPNTICSGALDGTIALWSVDSGTLQYISDYEALSHQRHSTDENRSVSASTSKHFAFCTIKVGYVSCPRVWMTITNGTVLAASVSGCSNDGTVLTEGELRHLQSRAPFTEQELAAFMHEKKLQFDAVTAEKENAIALLRVQLEELGSRNVVAETGSAERGSIVGAFLSRCSALHQGERSRISDAMQRLHDEASSEASRLREVIKRSADGEHASAVVAEEAKRALEIAQEDAEVHRRRADDALSELAQCNERIDALEADQRKAKQIEARWTATCESCVSELSTTKQQLAEAYDMLRDATGRETEKEDTIIELEESRSKLVEHIDRLEENHRMVLHELDEAAKQEVSKQLAAQQLQDDLRLQRVIAERDSWMERFAAIERTVADFQSERAASSALVDQLRIELTAVCKERDDSFNERTVDAAMCSDLQRELAACRANSATLASQCAANAQLAHENREQLQNVCFAASESTERQHLEASRMRDWHELHYRCRVGAFEEAVRFQLSGIVNGNSTADVLHLARQVSGAHASLTKKNSELLEELRGMQITQLELQRTLEDAQEQLQQLRDVEMPRCLAQEHETVASQHQTELEARLKEADDAWQERYREAQRQQRRDLQLSHSEQLQRTLNDLEVSHASQIATLELRIDTLQSELLQRQDELQALVEQDEERTIDLSRSEEWFHKQRMSMEETFKTQIVMLSSERDQLRAHLQTLSDKVGSMERRNAELTESVKRGKDANEALSKHVLDVESSFEQQLARLHADNNQLSQRVQNLTMSESHNEARVHEHHAELMQAHQRESALDRELQTLRQREEHYKQREESLKRDLRRAMSEADDVLRKYDTEVERHNGTKEAYQSLELTLQRNAVSTESDKAELQRRLEGVTKQLHDAERRNQLLHEDIREWQQRSLQWETDRRRTEMLLMQGDAATQRHHEEQRALVEAKNRLLAMQHEIAKMSSHLLSSDAEVNKLRAAHRDKDELLAILASEVQRPGSGAL